MLASFLSPSREAEMHLREGGSVWGGKESEKQKLGWGGKEEEQL